MSRDQQLKQIRSSMQKYKQTQIQNENKCGDKGVG